MRQTDGSPVRNSDAPLRLRAPSGSTLRVAVEAKRLVEPRDVPRLRERLDRELDRGVYTVGLVAVPVDVVSAGSSGRVVDRALSESVPL